MPWRMQHFNGYIAKFKNFVVFCLVNGETRFRFRTVNDCCASGFGEVEMAAYKVSMKMCLEYILNGSISLSSNLQININIP